MNPYLILGALVFAILAALAGHHNGKRIERAEWLAKENKELVAANAKIDQLHRAARDKEAAHAAAINLVSTTYQGELNAARAETKRLASAARAGDVRLRVNATCVEAGGGSAGTPVSGPGGRDAAAGADLPRTAVATLSGEDSAFLIELASEADDVVRQLTACQAIVRKDREAF